MDDAATQTILEKFLDLRPLLDERARRVWAATEARALGWGGIARVAEATGMSRVTIANGLKELAAGVDASDRQRAPGAGRKRAEERDPGLAKALERLVDPATRGDPAGPLLWTSLSAARLAAALQEQGRQVSERTVNRLLHEMGYSLQSNRKTLEGRQHPDRDAQFNHVNRRAKAFQRSGDPVVSVDTKKKELVGDFRNGGREWRPKGEPEKVRVHDFKDAELGKAIPYGVYDVAADEGWVSVGMDHHTASFAVATLRRWWERMGRAAYPAARRLLVTADAGGSNGSRNRLWKLELQRFAERDRAEGVGVPLPARDEQVEQDRAPDVLLDHPELARPAAGEPSGGGEPDRQHDDEDGTEDTIGTRRERVSAGDEGDRRADGRTVACEGQIPRRLELHDFAEQEADQVTMLIMRAA